jgi:hypothetical protein
MMPLIGITSFCSPIVLLTLGGGYLFQEICQWVQQKTALVHTMVTTKYLLLKKYFNYQENIKDKKIIEYKLDHQAESALEKNPKTFTLALDLQKQAGVQKLALTSSSQEQCATYQKSLR